MTRPLRTLRRGTLAGVLLAASLAASATAADLPRVAWAVEAPGGTATTQPNPITIVPDGSLVIAGRTNADGRAIVSAVAADRRLIGSVDLGSAWPGIAAVRSTTTEAPSYGVWAVSSGYPIRIAAIDPSRPARTGSDIVLGEAFGSAVDAVVTPPAAKAPARLYILTNTSPAGIVAIDLAARRVVDEGNLEGDRRADAIAISPDGARLIVAHSPSTADGAAPAITTYDTRTLGPDEGDIAIPGGRPTMAITTSPDGALAYLSQSNGQKVAKVDLATRRGLGLSAGSGPWISSGGGLGVSPDGGTLLYAALSTEATSRGTFLWNVTAAGLSFSRFATKEAGQGGAVAVDPASVYAYVASGSRDSARVAKVQIAPEPRQLTVRIAGRGGGLIDAAPGGLLCGKGLDCAGTYPDGSAVQLVATPNPGTVFTGWSGACTGTDDDCLVTMNGAQTVTATFAPAPSSRRTVTFGVAAGSGSVRSSTAAEPCTSVCSASEWLGATMTLTAIPASGSAFVRWEGACSGTATTCSLTVDHALVATAVFAKVPDPEPEPTPPAPDPTPPTPDPTPPTPEPTPTPDPTPPTPSPEVPIVTPVPGPNPPGPTTNADVPAPLVISGLTTSRATVLPGQGAIVRYQLSRSARVRMTFTHGKNSKLRYVYTIPAGRAGADAGTNRVHLNARVNGRNVRPGRWLVTVEAIGQDDQRSSAKRVVTVRPGR